MPSSRSFLRRSSRVALTVGGLQAVCFVVGWFILYSATHERVAESVEEVIIDANAATARSIATCSATSPPTSSTSRPSGGARRTSSRTRSLPAGGFACILDEDGYIACHPDIEESPGLRDVQLSTHEFRNGADGALQDLGSVPTGSLQNGTVRFGLDGKHYVSTLLDRESGAQLVVHQPVSGLTAASENITAGLVVLALGIGAVVCGLTALLGYLLVRAHDRELVRWNETLEDRVEEQAGQIRRAHRGIIFGIAKLAEYRDNETGMHVERMCAYSEVLAQELSRRGVDIDAEWIEQLRLAASLHDIGKVAIPDAVLLKPGRLDEGEFAVMKTHAATGCEALEAVREQVGEDALLEMGIEISGAHHEKWDGSGYPRGIAGTEIPLSARIVAVADVFDALMSKRVYKPAMPFAEVEAIIEDGRGKHFDPAVVDAFHAVKGELLEIRGRLQDVDDVPSLAPHRENVQPVEAA